jgi:hypothetical protein
VIIAIPAEAEVRTVQSTLTKPFPFIGDAVVGCRDPADTVHWIETSPASYQKTDDTHGQILRPSLREIAIAVRGFFHAYIATGDCWGYEDGDKVTIEAQGRWYGVDMMCGSDPHGSCYWIPAVDLQVGDDFSAVRR